MKECTHPTASRQIHKFDYFTADRTIRGAGRLANFQANAPMASFTIFFYCLALLAIFSNYNFCIEYNDLHLHCHQEDENWHENLSMRCKAKRCHCTLPPSTNTLWKLHPTVLKDKQKIQQLYGCLQLMPTLSNFPWGFFLG